MDKFQRLILINQYLILEKLYPEDADGFALHREAFEKGYELNYEWAVQGMDEVVTERQCQEVVDILQLHRVLLRHFEDGLLPESVSREDLKFDGFDGNGEIEHYAYAEYFIMRLGRFQEQLDNLRWNNSLNSHMPRLDKYRGMLRRWSQSDNKYKLSPEDIERIVNGDN